MNQIKALVENYSYKSNDLDFDINVRIKARHGYVALKILDYDTRRRDTIYERGNKKSN